MKRTTKTRLTRGVMYAIFVAAVAALVLAADWPAIQKAFFNVEIARELFPDVVVIASSIDMPDPDVFDTPEDSSDDEDVDMGITLVVEADSPLPFFDEVETLKFFFNMRNMTEISVKASTHTSMNTMVCTALASAAARTPPVRM